MKYYEKQTEKILNRWKKGLEQKINDLNENLEKRKPEFKQRISIDLTSL
ncbi:hypothetical protein [Calidifontibacillus erzurumensis]|nr:hypothetical protein [Calidifontibacillus erzurumensis]